MYVYYRMLTQLYNYAKYLLGYGCDKCVFVFDLDNTITNRHTGGRYGNGDFMTYITPEMKRSTRDTFKEIKRAGHKIYINSRGHLLSVHNFCKDSGLHSYIDGYYCAKDSRYTDHITDHTYSKHPMSSYWPDVKKIHLDLIANREGVEPDQIYFFDDTRSNVQTALRARYVNSHVVDSNHQPDPNEEGNLVHKLRSILKDIG